MKAGMFFKVSFCLDNVSVFEMLQHGCFGKLFTLEVNILVC